MLWPYSHLDEGERGIQGSRRCQNFRMMLPIRRVWGEISPQKREAIFVFPVCVESHSEMSKVLPTVLYVGCDYTEHQPEEWTKFTNYFNVIIYDCPSVDEFIRRMAPGEEYSNIDAIMRPSWLKAPPFQHQYLFRGKSVDCYPAEPENHRERGSWLRCC